MRSMVHRGAARSHAAVVTIALGLLLAAVGGACSLLDTKRSDCISDDQCAGAFGAGSRCSAGYCTEPGSSSSSSSGGAGCSGKNADGQPCSCKPMTSQEIENACTSVSCVPFDDSKRLTKLLADGGLPPLPP